jgi:hypothetical protein
MHEKSAPEIEICTLVQFTNANYNLHWNHMRFFMYVYNLSCNIKNKANICLPSLKVLRTQDAGWEGAHGTNKYILIAFFCFVCKTINLNYLRMYLLCFVNVINIQSNWVYHTKIKMMFFIVHDVSGLRLHSLLSCTQYKFLRLACISFAQRNRLHTLSSYFLLPLHPLLPNTCVLHCERTTNFIGVSSVRSNSRFVFRIK